MASYFDIYEQIILKFNVEQKKFLIALNNTISELFAEYGEIVFVDNTPPTADIQWSDIVSGLKVCFKPLFVPAVVDNIIYLLNTTADNVGYKQEFMRKARQAFLKYWNDNAKGRRVKKIGW